MATVDAERRTPTVARRKTARLVLGIVGTTALLWAGWLWWSDRNYRRAILTIELEMANGRFGIAARELNRLLERYPVDAEAAILLGRCEQERGHWNAAGLALARVTPGSALAHKAILARMRLFHDQGQFANAEQLINEAALDPRNERAHLQVLLVPIFSQLGRLDEAQRLLEAWWDELNHQGEGASERAIDQVRMHIELEFKPNPKAAVRSYLHEAYARAPGDDRVWLGLANLAIRTGDFQEAKRWLDACLKLRPDDVPVWSARLRLGVASNQVNRVEEALAHLPAGAVHTAEIHRIAAWLAARRGDRQSEQRQLERLIVFDPADLEALDRLARLTELAGQPTQRAELAAGQSAIRALRDRYLKLFDRNQPIRDAEELARIATRLGRTFEARAFLTVEIAEDPERADLRRDLDRLPRVSAASLSDGQTLANVVARELGQKE